MGNKMFHETLKILLIGDSNGAIKQVRDLLGQTDIPQFELENVSERLAAINSFRSNSHDVCIIDSAKQGIELVAESRRVGFTAPIIVLTGNSAHEVLTALRNGALDCLVKEEITAASLEQSICAAIERANLMEAQAQHQRCYLGLVENASDIIYTHDLNGNYTFINRAAEQLTGYGQEDILRMSLADMIADEYLESVWRSVRDMLSDHRRTLYNAVIVTKDRQRIPIRVSAHLIFREGIPIGVQGVARRIAWQSPSMPLTEGEQHYRTLREN
jgi:PAS domain S-box-containing protein